MRPKLTLDTNCVINVFERGQTATSIAELEALCSLAASGKIDIAVTTRFPADLHNDEDTERRSRILKLARQLPKLGTIARLNVSFFNSGDVLASTNDVILARRIRAILFPNFQHETPSAINKLNDVDHLVGHVINRRDVFLTDDRGILKREKDLRNLSPHLRVMDPGSCLREIESGDFQAK